MKVFLSNYKLNIKLYNFFRDKISIVLFSEFNMHDVITIYIYCLKTIKNIGFKYDNFNFVRSNETLINYIFLNTINNIKDMY